MEAFDVFTQEIGDWWQYDRFFRLTPRSPGVMAFEAPSASGGGGRLVEKLANGKIFEVGPVRLWAPGERLVVGWRQATFGPEHATEVEVRFEAVGEETRVTIEHRGWDSVPQDHVARHRFPLVHFQQRQAENWNLLLRRIRERIEAHD
jgi:hypothetical protein